MYHDTVTYCTHVYWAQQGHVAQTSCPPNLFAPLLEIVLMRATHTVSVTSWADLVRLSCP